MSDGRSGASRHLPALASLLLPALAALLGALLVPVDHAWGWDESMHAEAPAVRMLLAWRQGGFGDFAQALHACEQYPFGWPLALAVLQALGGIGEGVARAGGWLAYALLLYATGLAARVLAAPEQGRARAAHAPWIATLLALLSPLCLAFAPTLFLEVPSALAWLLAFLAWCLCERAASPRRAFALGLAAGLAASLAFFIKFNYGVLGCAALALDGALRLLRAPAGERRRHALSLVGLALPLATVWLWWFVLPLPFGAATAASHRAAFLAYLGGNLGQASAPWTTRALHWSGYLCGSPLAALLLIVGAAASLARPRAPALRTAWLFLACLELPALLHPFHLERFLIVGAPYLWLLAAHGWERIARGRPAPRLALLGGLLLGLASAPWQLERAAAWLGVLPPAGPGRDHARRVFAGWVHPDWRRRSVATAGLLRSEHDALLDRLAGALAGAERIGWPAVPSELSPAALHLGLLARGAETGRWLESWQPSGFYSIANADPGDDPRSILDWSTDYDVLILTDPPDLKARPGRDWLRPRLSLLRESDELEVQPLGSFELEGGAGKPNPVSIELLRRRAWPR